jgi:phosphatidylglycerol---prolipoprotein diacylglyceryl transferase
MPRSKSRKTNRRGTAAAKTASSRTRREGQVQPQAEAAAPQAAAGTSAARPRVTDTAAASQAPAKATAARTGSARGTAAGSAAVNGGPPGAAPGKGLPTGLAPDRGRAKASAPPAPAAKTAAAKTAAADEAADDLPVWAAKAAEKLLTVTYWLDPGEQGDPFSATIYFSGKRTEVSGKPKPGDSFSQEETVEGIVPGSGPVAITAEVRGVNPGDWAVTARPVARPGGSQVRPYPPPGANGGGALRVPWPRRVAIPASPTATARTAMLPFTKVPGVIRFAYAALVSLGVLVGLGVETLLLTAHHYSAVRPILLSVAAVVGGVVGAKAWYVGVHRGRKFDGWCIQGFVAGVAVVAGVAASVGAGVPAGVYLSATAPALLIGIGIGRPGCFWAGCCTGRPTASRWGIWSSDRRLGCRRAPAQLLEAASAMITGLAVLAVVLIVGLQRSGPVAVAGLAAYTLGRQFALGLRSEPRRFRHGRQVTMAVAVVVLIVSLALLGRG